MKKLLKFHNMFPCLMQLENMFNLIPVYLIIIRTSWKGDVKICPIVESQFLIVEHIF